MHQEKGRSIPESNFRLNNFDLLRLFAATEVLLRHTYHHLAITVPSWVTVMGKFPGVPMFFVMSGFLISYSYNRSKSLNNYFRNRALRIFPALWFCLILTIPTISFFGNISFLNAEFIPWIVSNSIGVIYTPAFLAGFGFGSYNGSLWTISIELQFYFILPAVYFIFSKLTKRESKKTILTLGLFLIFTYLAYFVLKYHTNPENETFQEKALRYTFLPHVYLFFFGVLLQQVRAHQSSFIVGKGGYYFTVFLISQFLLPQTPLLDIAGKVLLGVTTISVAYTLPSLSHKLLRGNDISYGMYIFHGLILGVAVEKELFHKPFYVFLILLSSCFVSYISWKFIEKPMLNKKRVHSADYLNTKMIQG